MCWSYQTCQWEQVSVQITETGLCPKDPCSSTGTVSTSKGKRRGIRCPSCQPPSKEGIWTCPLACKAMDRNGYCLSFSKGTCSSTGQEMYHYHSLKPVIMTIDGLEFGSQEPFSLSNATMETIMRQIWEHGPITAVMAIYQVGSSIHSALRDIMINGGIYTRNAVSATIHGFHAVLIIGWGVANGVLYWKCANSWGTSQTDLIYSNTLGAVKAVVKHYPEKGCFRILRGKNFCGIESSLIYAEPVKDRHTDQSSYPNITKRAKAAGGWYELPADEPHVGVSRAVSHFVSQPVHEGTARRAAPALHNHRLTKVMHQVVAGSNYHLVLTAEHVESGEQYQMQGIVHQDLSGRHFIKHSGAPTLIRKNIAAAEPKNLASTTNGDATKASSAPVNSAAAHGSPDSDGKVHVPTWALWLTGALFAALLTVVVGQQYAISDLRQKLSGTPTTAIKLAEVEDPRTCAPSQTTMDVVSNADSASTATLKASNPRSPTSSELRSRSASQEGVICLD